MLGLVCIDVDGTLVGASGEVPEGVWEAAAELRAAGVRLAICSGRPAFGLARDYASRLDPEGWHVFQNGASIVHLPGGESRSQPMPDEGVQWMLDRTRRTRQTLELYADADHAVITDEHGLAQRHAELLGIDYVPGTLESLRTPVVRGLWLVPPDELPDLLTEAPGCLTLAPALAPSMPDTVFVNVTPAGVDKAEAVRRVADAWQLPLSAVMMIGDGANDAVVMHIVGYSVAMGNAEPEVLAVARHRVAHVDRGGLMEALAIAAAIAPHPRLFR